MLEKYLETLGLAVVALDGFLDYLAELCEEPPPTARIDTTTLNQGLSEIIAELSVIAKAGGEAPS